MASDNDQPKQMDLFNELAKLDKMESADPAKEKLRQNRVGQLTDALAQLQGYETENVPETTEKRSFLGFDWLKPDKKTPARKKLVKKSSAKYTKGQIINVGDKKYEVLENSNDPELREVK